MVKKYDLKCEAWFIGFDIKVFSQFIFKLSLINYYEVSSAPSTALGLLIRYNMQIQYHVTFPVPTINREPSSPLSIG